jgi:hypothetical protein
MERSQNGAGAMAEYSRLRGGDPIFNMNLFAALSRPT